MKRSFKTFISLLICILTISSFLFVYANAAGEEPPPKQPIGTTYVYTPKNVPVFVYIFDEDLPEHIAYYDNLALELFPYISMVNMISNSTHTYNCHSYAWNFKSIMYGTYWMNDPTPYFEGTNKSYKVCTSQSASNTTTKFLYRTSNGTIVHSACFFTTDEYHVSKWGRLSVFVHRYDQNPYYLLDGARYITKYVPID